MRLSLRPDGVWEWLALRLRLVPVPAAQAWGGMALSGVLVAAVETGLTDRLAKGPATAAQLQAELGLDPTATSLLLHCLRSAGYLSDRGGVYRLRRTARQWLDPRGDRSVAGFVRATGDYWRWWAQLPQVLRGSAPAEHHDLPADDPYWPRYQEGQRDLARLSADLVARAVHIRSPRTMLDLGGGHGWYSAALCHRFPGLTATVLDLPAAAALGPSLVAGAPSADRVAFRAGDVRTTDLGSDHDLVCCFNLLHHLTEDEIGQLLARVHAALAPGGVLAILDVFQEPGATAAGDMLSMFVYLSSGARLYPPERLRQWLADAGFPASPSITRLRQIPGLVLVQTRREA
jgi:SAM-dependent methyltransferase